MLLPSLFLVASLWPESWWEKTAQPRNGLKLPPLFNNSLSNRHTLYKTLRVLPNTQGAHVSSDEDGDCVSPPATSLAFSFGFEDKH